MKQRILGLVVAFVALGCGDDTPPPGGDGGCATAAECDDGVFCNGAEFCSMGGCAAGSPPCAAALCDEADDRCMADCAEPDADGDGVDAIDCGGTDCDDDDPDRFPGNPEVCDEAGVDEDCDPTTLGDRDVDGDGHIAAECCNGDTCGDDCADRLADVFGGATETCDLRDQDCDGDVDEGVSVSLFVDDDGDLYGDGGSIQACAGSARTSTSDIDCDGAMPQRHGAQVEVCDGVDNDCDDEVDENTVVFPWYPDTDGDGFGDPGAEPTISCAPPAGHSLLPLDCDDTDAALSPGADELCNARDDDCDGVAGFVIARGDTEDDDRDGFADDACGGDDCDDMDPFNHPGGIELCDGLDNDCDGTIDEGAVDVDWFLDTDGDGYGDDSESIRSCERQHGRVLVGGDCADGNALVHPGVRDRCNGFDDDCDGTTDEGRLGAVLGFRDEDSDGYGLQSDSMVACAGALPAGYATTPGDCNDTVADINPGAADVCDSADNDCDIAVDEEPDIDWYADGDGDGYGVGAVLVTQCAMPAGAASQAGDCNDGDPDIAPMTPEVCDGADQDCDLNIDETLPGMTFYPDGDGDGYAADDAVAMLACGPLGNLVATRGDCDDTTDAIGPDATEVCDGVDNDCDMTVDTDALDNFCAGPGTTGICVAGGAPLQCACSSAAIADCDAIQGNGCETTLATSNDHCGMCGNACTAVQFCDAGACAAAPIEGFVVGAQNSCVRRGGGRYVCWGRAQALFMGTQASTATVASALELLDVISLNMSFDTNYWHHCAIVDAGAGARDIHCMGKNNEAQLGIGFTSWPTDVPPTRIVAAVDDTIGDWEELAMGTAWTLARRANGEIWGWGRNTSGQLGRAASSFEATPIRVTTIADATGIAAGFLASCAIRTGGGLECWGNDTSGSLGNGSAGSTITPGPVVVLGGAPLTGVVEVDLARYGGCARRTDGTVWCWGLARGDGSASVPQHATQVPGVVGAVDIACGEGSCCAAASGNAWCWGAATHGQLGNHVTSGNDFLAGRVLLGDGTTPLGGVIGVDGGRDFTCARLNTNQLVCWGYNGDGSLGRGTVSSGGIPHAGAPDPVMGL